MSLWEMRPATLTHLFPMHPFSTPSGNIRKRYCFLTFSEGGERKGALGTNRLINIALLFN